MTERLKKESFVQRYLDPASRLGEILFGLIMVLSITLTAGINIADGKEGVRQLLVAAIGCNVAWGIIDGIMYVMNCLAERSGRFRLARLVQGAPNSTTALGLVREAIEADFADVAAVTDRENFYQAIVHHVAHARITKNHINREDVYGGIACFWLVFVSCLPAALPFLIFSQPTLALRVSNFLLIAMLFLVGQKWAEYADTNRLLAGLTMVVIGLALVGVAILLGG